MDSTMSALGLLSLWPDATSPRLRLECAGSTGQCSVFTRYFLVFHWLQTRFWYDGLAQDVPEVTALGSVALMLIIVLIIETPRRGLILGKKIAFPIQFLRIAREYHGYVFTWALIYTFWYHPMEDTPGHLLGFFYMALLLSQSVFLFHRGHYSRLWKLSLELLVIPHGVIVALLQGNQLWPMFGFGFGAIFVLTQMYALNIGSRIRQILVGIFLLAIVVTYLFDGPVGSDSRSDQDSAFRISCCRTAVPAVSIRSSVVWCHSQAGLKTNIDSLLCFGFGLGVERQGALAGELININRRISRAILHSSFWRFLTTFCSFALHARSLSAPLVN